MKRAVMLSLLLVGCSADDASNVVPSDRGEKALSVATELAARRAAPIGPCAAGQLLAYSPTPEVVSRHRERASLISYPYGTKLPGNDWGIEVALRIDESGRVACYGTKDGFDRSIHFNSQRIASLRELRFQPFLVDGAPTSAVIKEEIREQEMPAAHIPLPVVSPDKLRISLERTGCFGSCPAYRVDVHGNGQVVYTGESFVDVEGTHRYRIPARDVAALVESLRDKDLWSMRPSYHASITDNPSYVLTIAMGSQIRQIHDYVGEMVGMPVAVTEFEDQVDKVARSGMWINLSLNAVELLEEEAFPFDSQAGGELLRRAMQNDRNGDDGAVSRLIELGAPLEAEEDAPRFPVRNSPLLEVALRNRRLSAVEPLIERGALGANGRVEQSRLDAAFRAAVEGGSLQLVEQVWAAGGALKPALYFEDVSEDKTATNAVPVTLLLRPPYRNKQTWQGLEIAQWLQARGCDLKASAASGKTLLHIAADAGDQEFVRYLLDQGLDPSELGEYELPAIGSADDEEVALILLKAGTNLSTMEGGSREFMRYAEARHWGRVVAWLRKHPQ